jgi:hypothetical protein
MNVHLQSQAMDIVSHGGSIIMVNWELEWILQLDVFHNPERMKFDEGSRVIKLCCGSKSSLCTKWMINHGFLSFFFFSKLRIVFEN